MASPELLAPRSRGGESSPVSADHDALAEIKYPADPTMLHEGSSVDDFKALFDAPAYEGPRGYLAEDEEPPVAPTPPSPAATSPSSRPDPTRLTFASVDMSYDAKQAAADAARERLTNELNEGGRFKRFVNGIWKGNAAKPYYERKYRDQALREIEGQGNIHAHVETDNLRRIRAQQATVDRFQSEYEEAIHHAAGEDIKDLKDSPLATEIKRLIRENIEGTLSDEGLIEEKNRVRDALRDADPNALLGEGRVEADNMLEIVAAVKGAIEHGESLDDVLANMRVISGDARSGVRTEAKYNKTDKIIDRLEKSKIAGLLATPEAVVAAATIGLSVARWGSHSVLGAVTKTVVPGLGAAIWGGLREHKRLQDDWIQHSREGAQGKQFEAGSKRREKMEEVAYERTHVDDLIAMVDVEGMNLDSKEAIEAAIDALGDVTTRINMSDARRIDLIKYSDTLDVDDQRFALDMARAQAKVAINAKLDPAMRTALGFRDGETLDQYVSERSMALIESLDDDIDARDAARKRMMLLGSAKAAGISAATSFIGGAVFQEGMAAFSDTRTGLIEELWDAKNNTYNGEEHQTILHGLVHGNDNHPDIASKFTDHTVGEHGKMSLSNNLSFGENKDGTIFIKNSDGNVVANHLSADSKGALTPESMATLKNSGLSVHDTSHVVDLGTTKETRTGTLKDFLRTHKGETTRVTRDGWYDNDTAAFDRNELKLWWGGHDNNGIGKHGGFQFSVSQMTQGGSFHDGQHAHWHELAKEGKLKMFISGSRDAQHTPFMVDINPDGTADIPKGSPAAQFFSVHDGQAVFNGKYAEVAQVSKPDAHGVTHIRPLATEVGNDTAKSHPYEFQKSVPHTEIRHEYTIRGMGGERTFTEMAPVTPVVSRKSLETVRRIEREDFYYAYNSSPEALREFRKEISPRLKRDPKARLKPREELDWHEKEIRKRGGSEYSKSIQEAVDASPELKNLPPDTKALITIPVAAASESDNIYKTLASYANQDGGLDRTTILLHVNWFDSAEADSEKAAGVQKTWDEIERAKRDFPQLRIATMKSVWSEEKKKNGEYGEGIIGHVARKMYDTALTAVQRSMEEGGMSDDNEVLLIRNDSDALGIRRSYLRNMIKNFEEHPENDIFTGTIRWGTHRHSDLPGFGFVSNFREVMHIATQLKGVKVWPPTVGINTAVRMSTLAAVNGIGYHPKKTGIGTDDYNIGGRVKDARQVMPTTARGIRRFWRMRSNSGDIPYTYSNGMNNEDYSYHRHVSGADIDTAPDRLEKTYLAGIPITRSWSNWDKELRDEGLSRGSKESLAKNPNEVVSHVEADMSASLTERYHDRAHVRMGLSMVLPTSIGGKPSYTILRNSRGKYVFKFTEEGKKWFVDRLERDTKGRHDPLGSRVRRRLYSEPTSGKKPRSSKPLMV